MWTRFLIVILVTLFCSSLPSNAIIKLDDNSVDLAVKYGIKMQGSSRDVILGENWINDGTGMFLNIYSPFIQVVMRVKDENTTDNPVQDLKNIRQKLKPQIDKIKELNEVRFISSLCGDNEEFAKDYKAYIISAEELYNKNPNKKLIKPKKSKLQKVAEKDNYVPKHPYSAVNSYIFNFSDISGLKNYVFVLLSGDGKEIKYFINNNKIF